MRLVLPALVAFVSAAAAFAHPPVYPRPRPVPRPGPHGPIVVSPLPHPVRVYHPPVVVTGRVYVRTPVIAPRVIARPWLSRPAFVTLRYYPVPITPIYVPLLHPEIVPGQDVTESLEQGELWPADTRMMSYFTHYTVAIERHYYAAGGAQTTLTLYPQEVCQDPNGCPPLETPPPSRLLVTSETADSCGVKQVTAVAYEDGPPISSIRLTDYSRYYCDEPVAYGELTATVTHASGFAEPNLAGNRTY
jgi:hypothetical protein